MDVLQFAFLLHGEYYRRNDDLKESQAICYSKKRIACEIDQYKIVEAVSDNKAANKIIPFKIKVEVKQNKNGKKKYLVQQFVCNKCGLVCNDYYEYDKHMLDRSETHKFACRCCDEKFLSVRSLWQHAGKSHIFSDFLEAEAKYVTKNPLRSLYHCDFCGHQDAFLQVHMQHKQKYHINWLIKCPMCTSKFRYTFQLFEHFQAVHALVNNVDLYCRPCALHFYCPIVYKSHMLTVHEKLESDLSFKCILCPAVLSNLGEFCLHVHNHRKYIHTIMPDGKFSVDNKRPLYRVKGKQCHICSQIVNSDIKQHLKMDHGLDKTCGICYAFVSSEEFDSHFVKHHSSVDTPEANMLSPIEQKSATVVSSVEKNPENFPSIKREPKATKYNAPNENKFLDNKTRECYICFALVDKLLLSDHNKMHRYNGTKPFKIPNPSLKNVSEQKPVYIKCRFCKLKFRKSFMTTHNNIHEAEKVFRENRIKVKTTKKKNKSYQKDKDTYVRYDNDFDYDDDDTAMIGRSRYDQEDALHRRSRSRSYERQTNFYSARDDEDESLTSRQKGDSEDLYSTSDIYADYGSKRTYDQSPESDSLLSRYDRDRYSFDQRYESHYKETDDKYRTSHSREPSYENVQASKRYDDDNDYDRRSKGRRSEKRHYRSKSPLDFDRRNNREYSRERNYKEETYRNDKKRKLRGSEDELSEKSTRRESKRKSKRTKTVPLDATQKKELEIKCTECGTPFDTIENMVNHMKQVHFSATAIIQHPVPMQYASQIMQGSAQMTQNQRFMNPHFSNAYGYQYHLNMGQSNYASQMYQQAVRFGNMAGQAVNPYWQMMQQYNQNQGQSDVGNLNKDAVNK